MSTIIRKITTLLLTAVMAAVFFSLAVSAEVIEFADVSTPSKAYLACETVEKEPTEYFAGETITFRIEFRFGDDLVSVPKFNYSIKAEDDTVKSGTASGENGYFEVETAISKPGVVRIIVTPRNEDGTELKNGTSSYRMVGGACADIDDIQMVMEEPNDFDEYWSAAIEELYTVFPNIISIEKDTDNSTDRYDVYRVYIDCVGKKEFLSTAAEGEAPNGDTYVAAKLTIDKELQPGEGKFALGYQGAGIYSTPGFSKKEGYITLNVSAHSILIDQDDAYYDTLETSVLPGNYLRREKYNDSAELSYKKYIFMRDLQGVRFLKEFFGANGAGQGTVDGVDTSAWAGLWNGVDIEVSGSSQGAWQSLAVAALDRDVTKLVANVPGMSDIYSSIYEPGRNNYDSGFYHYSQKYFDGVSMARRIKCDSYVRTGFGDEQCPASIVICVYNALNCKKELKIWQCMPHGQSKTYADGTAKPSWTFTENFSLGYSDSLTFEHEISSIEGTAVALGSDGKTITGEEIGSATVIFENGRPSVLVEVVPSTLNIAVLNGFQGDTAAFEAGLDSVFGYKRNGIARIAEGWSDFGDEINSGKYVKGESFFFIFDDGSAVEQTRKETAASLLASFEASGADYCAMLASPTLGTTAAAMYAMQLDQSTYKNMYVAAQTNTDLGALGRAAGNAILAIVDENQPYDDNVISLVNTENGARLDYADIFETDKEYSLAIIPSEPHAIRDGILFSSEGLNESDMLVFTGDSDGGSISVNGIKYEIYPGGNAYGKTDTYSWILDDGGVLRIFGTDVSGEFTFAEHASLIKEIVIERGVKNISVGAFASLSELTKITLPHSLETIASDSVCGGASFEIVGYENNEAAVGFASALGVELTSIGLAFDAGADLTAVLSDGVLTISGTGTKVDSGCNASYGSWASSAWYEHYSEIEKVVINAPVKTVAGGCFTLMKQLRTVEIPQTLTTIEGYGFSFCYALETIYISGNEPITGTLDLSNVTSIGTYAFSIVRGFERVRFSEELKTLTGHSFSSASNFTVVEIPESVTTIAANSLSHSQTNASGAKTIFIKGSPSFGGANAFKDVSGTRIICFTEATYNAVRSFGYTYIETFYADGFVDYGVEDDYVWMIDKNYELTVISDGSISGETYPWSAYNSSIKSIVLSEGAAVIGSGAFANMELLEEVRVPYTVTSAESDIFDGCSAFTLYGYDNCEDILSIAENNDNIEFVSLGAYGTAGDGLQWKYSDGVLEVFGTGTVFNPGTSSLYNSWTKSSFYSLYKKITKVMIGPSVTEIGGGALANMDALISVEIPATLTRIGGQALAYCDKLSSVYVTGSEPVSGMYDLSGITSLGSYGVHMCKSLKKLVLGDITSIPSHAVSKCVALETVTVNNTSRVTVSSNAFYSSVDENVAMKAVAFSGPMTANSNSFTDVDVIIICDSSDDAAAFNELGYQNAKAICIAETEPALKHTGFAVRLADYNGLRGLFSFDRTVAAANEIGGNTLVEYGAIIASKNNYDTYGAELTFDGNEYVTANEKIAKRAVFIGEEQVGKVLSFTESTVNFAATVTNFTNNYTTDIYFCAYEIWRAADGTEVIIYTDCENDEYDCTNIYEISINMYKDGLVNGQNDTESIVWDILSEAGAVTLAAGTDYTLTEGVTDLDGNAFGETFTFRDVIAVTQSSSKTEKLLTFGKSDVTITLLVDPEGGYVAVYRPIGESGTVPGVASSAYNSGRGNQLHSSFGKSYTHSSTTYTADTKRPNPTISSAVYQQIHTVIADHGISKIESGAFTNNAYTTTYVYPTTLKTLGTHAFYASTGITAMFMADPENGVKYEDGLVDLSNISSVGTSYLFTTSVNIAKIHLPSSVKSIDSTFISVGSKTTTALQKVWCGDSAEPENGIIDLTGANITSIGSLAFKGAANITTLKLPDSCTSINAKAFYDRTSTATMASLVTIVQEIKADAVATYCGTSIAYVNSKGESHISSATE